MKNLSILKNPRFWILTLIVLILALSRLMEHPWNFTPIAAMALFGGVYFAKKRLAILIPLLALFISDLFIGFYPDMIFTYSGFALIGLIGIRLRNNIKPVPVMFGTLFGAVTFYLISNFGVWLMAGLYPISLAGLIDCYLMGLPFFRYTMMGDIVYVAILFGSFELLKIKFPQLAKQRA